MDNNRIHWKEGDIYYYFSRQPKLSTQASWRRFQFKVKLKSEVEGDEIYVELNDREDGTYSAEYTVDKLYGNLTLSVCLRGAHINGSPFSVRVETPRPTQKTTYPQYPRSLLYGHGLSLQKPQYTPGSYSLSTGYNATGTCSRKLTPKRGSPYRF